MSYDEETFKTAPPAGAAEGHAAPEDNGAASSREEAAPTEEPWVVEEWIDGTPYDPGKPGPFDDNRLPEDEGPPYPPGLIDPLSSDLIDAARHVLRFIFHDFWDSPKWMAWLGQVW